jgi:hypothetical protein
MTSNPTEPTPIKKTRTRKAVSNKALFKAVEKRLEDTDLTVSATIGDLLEAIKDDWFSEQ